MRKSAAVGETRPAIRLDNLPRQFMNLLEGFIGRLPPFAKDAATFTLFATFSLQAAVIGRTPYKRLQRPTGASL